jgi:4-carboxymuconolactone decarboxylase
MPEPTPAQRAIGDFAPKLVDLTDEVLFGDIWERPELAKRDRSLITVATLTEAVNLYEAPALGNYWAASCVSGWLIQATVGRAGGWGGLRTNRSG